MEGSVAATAYSDYKGDTKIETSKELKTGLPSEIPKEYSINIGAAKLSLNPSELGNLIKDAAAQVKEYISTKVVLIKNPKKYATP